jgi:hypothetical protein
MFGSDLISPSDHSHLTVLLRRMHGLRPKNVTILGLPRSFPLLHIVCPQGRLRYYLLLTGIHKLLAPIEG